MIKRVLVLSLLLVGCGDVQGYGTKEYVTKYGTGVFRGEAWVELPTKESVEAVQEATIKALFADDTGPDNLKKVYDGLTIEYWPTLDDVQAHCAGGDVLACYWPRGRYIVVRAEPFRPVIGTKDLAHELVHHVLDKVWGNYDAEHSLRGVWRGSDAVEHSVPDIARLEWPN